MSDRLATWPSSLPGTGTIPAGAPAKGCLGSLFVLNETSSCLVLPDCLHEFYILVNFIIFIKILLKRDFSSSTLAPKQQSPTMKKHSPL